MYQKFGVEIKLYGDNKSEIKNNEFYYFHSHPSKVFIFNLSYSLNAHVYSDGLPGDICILCNYYFKSKFSYKITS